MQQLSLFICQILLLLLLLMPPQYTHNNFGSVLARALSLSSKLFLVISFTLSLPPCYKFHNLEFIIFRMREKEGEIPKWWGEKTKKSTSWTKTNSSSSSKLWFEITKQREIIIVFFSSSLLIIILFYYKYMYYTNYL